SETRMPCETACRMMVKRSVRSRGSPPLRMSIGWSGAMLSTNLMASSVSSSSLSGSREAEARQYWQDRLQAAVSSQAMINMLRSEYSVCAFAANLKQALLDQQLGIEDACP